MYCVVEISEGNERNIKAAPSIWINNDKLRWPTGFVNRKNPCEPERDWNTYNCRIIKDSICTLQEALAQEHLLSKESNDVLHTSLKRQHPEKGEDTNSILERRLSKRVQNQKILLKKSLQSENKTKYKGQAKKSSKEMSAKGIVESASMQMHENAETMVAPKHTDLDVIENESAKTFNQLVFDSADVPEANNLDQNPRSNLERRQSIIRRKLPKRITKTKLPSAVKSDNKQRIVKKETSKREHLLETIPEDSYLGKMENGNTINVIDECLKMHNNLKDDEAIQDVLLQSIVPMEITEQTNYNNFQSEADLNSFIDSIISLSNHSYAQPVEYCESESRSDQNSAQTVTDLDEHSVHEASSSKRIPATVYQEVNSNLEEYDKPSEVESSSQNHLSAIYKEILEIRSDCITERAKRMEMEARFQSNFEILISSISKISKQICTKDGEVQIDKIMENQVALDSQDDPKTNEINYAYLDNEKQSNSTVTYAAETVEDFIHNRNIEPMSESDSESDAEPLTQFDKDQENSNTKSNTVATEQFQADTDSESDADSIPEPLHTKEGIQPKVVKLSIVSDNYYDDEGFMYSRNNVSGNKSLYLRCKNSVKFQCTARVIVKDNDLENAVLTTPHENHNANKKFVDKAKFFNKLAENCELDPFEKPLKLHLRTKEQMKDLIDEGHIPTSKQTRSFINDRLQEYLPNLPKTIEEFQAFIAQDRYQKRFAVNCRNLPFYRGVWESVLGERNIVFISQGVLKLLNTLNNVALFMDGTFKALPYTIKFGQLYVINLIYKNHCYPLAYILMEKRTFTAYDTILKNLKLLMPSVDVVKLMTDYEAATRKALRIHYPDARLSGCYFHYVQAIIKNAKRFNLLQDSKFKEAIQEVASLALLPNEFVVLGFNYIDERFQRKKSQRWNKFRNYWKRQWAGANISVYGLVDRTNNFSESANKTLNLLLKKPHPSIWELINTIRLIEMEKSDEIVKSSQGQMLTTKRNQNMVLLNHKILMATKLFEQTQDIGAFLKNVTYDEDLENYIKDRVDINVEDDEFDEVVIPNSFNIESDFRQRFPRESARLN